MPGEPGSPIENLSQHSLIPGTFFLRLPTGRPRPGPALVGKLFKEFNDPNYINSEILSVGGASF